MSVVLPPSLIEAPSDTLETRAYAVYQQDFGITSPETFFQSAKVIVKRNPHAAKADREHTYWHAVTKGEPEESRVNPVVERLVRIPWMRPVIGGWAEMRVWWEYRDSSTHWNIWHRNSRYVVIVKALAGGDYLLKTAYPTGFDLPKWQKRFHEAKKTGRALSDAP